MASETMARAWACLCLLVMGAMGATGAEKGAGGANFTGACARALHQLVLDVADLRPWAFKMADASAWLPRGLLAGQTVFLGRYDECLAIREAHYCLASLRIGPLGPDGRVRAPSMETVAIVQLIHLAELTQKAEGVSAALRFGLCLPAACAGEELEELAHPLISQLGLPLSLHVSSSACRGAEDPPRAGLRAADWIAAAALAALLLAAAVARHKISRRTRASGAVLNSAKMDKFNKGEEPALSPSPSPPPPARPSSNPGLPVLHGIRVVSMVQVVISHRFSHEAYSVLQNPIGMWETWDTKLSIPLKACMYSVDTFFFLSGVLVTYVYMNRLREKKSTPWMAFYLHRIIRLWPAMVAALLISRLMPLLEAGPVWWEQTSCEMSWTANLFFLGNWDDQPQCVGYLWYLSADTQMYLAAPLVLAALRRRPRRALQGLAIVAALGVVVRFILAYWGELPLVYPSLQTGLSSWTMSMQHLYKPSYTRFSPFLVGMALGYFLHRFKYERKPHVLSQAAVLGLWGACALLLASVLLPLHVLSLFTRPTRPVTDALYVAASHTAWALGLAAFILLAVLGRGGPVARFLSDPRWRPLSHLSYTIYLAHMPVVQADIASQRQPLYFGPWEVALRGLGDFTLAVPCAFVLSKLCEEPLKHFEALFVPRAGDTKEEEKNGKLPVSNKEKMEEYRRMV